MISDEFEDLNISCYDTQYYEEVEEEEKYSSN